MKLSTLILLILIFFYQINYCQNLEGSEPLEIYLIDSYCKPDSNHIFILSYYSSFPVKSKVVLENKYEFEVSNQFIELHKLRLDISKLKFNDRIVEFIIKSIDSSGNNYTSEIFDFDLPFEPQIKEGLSILNLCLLGGAIFLIPNPGLVIKESRTEWALTKEIPLLAFRNGFNYPSSFFSFELSYLNNLDHKFNYRLGYKKIWEIKSIEFISAGISSFYNSKNKFGFAPEVTIGFYKWMESFTFYARYRFNNFLSSNHKFHEIYLGFYSGFFSIYL